MPIEKLRLYQLNQASQLPDNYDITELHARSDDNIVPVSSIFANFLNSPKKVLLINGAAFTGKTRFCYWLQTPQAIDYQKNLWLPINIPLSTLGQAKTCVEDVLRERGLTDENIITAHELSLLLIFDGFGELGETQNLYISLHLHRWPKAKVIITSRSLYLSNQSMRHLLFAPFYHENALPHLLESIEILPLAPEILHAKILLSLQNHNIVNDIPINDLIQSWILNHPSLAQALLEPLFLYKFISQINELRDNSKNSTDMSHLLAQVFLSCWIDYHQQKTTSTLHQHVTHAPVIHLRTYMSRLAQKMQSFDTGIVRSQLTPSLFTTADTLTKQLFDWNDPAARIAFAECPIALMHGRVRFLHEDLFVQLQTEKDNESKKHSTSTSSQADVVPSLYPSSSTPLPSLEHEPLNTKNYVHDKRVIGFLADCILAGDAYSPRHTQYFLALLFSSRNNPAMQTASANAITILVAAEYDFTGMDLSYLHLAGANLNGINAAHANFQHTILDNCSMISARLPKAMFHNSSMRNIILGEMKAFFSNNGAISALRFVNNNKTLIILNSESERKCIEVLFNIYNESISYSFESLIARKLFNANYESNSRISSAICTSTGEKIITINEKKVISLTTIDINTAKEKKCIWSLRNETIKIHTLFNPGNIAGIYKRIFAIAFFPMERGIIYAPELITGEYQVYIQALNGNPFNLHISGMGRVQQIACIDPVTVIMAVITNTEQFVIRVYHMQHRQLLTELPGYRFSISTTHEQIAIASFDVTHQNFINIYDLNNFSLRQTLICTHKKRNDKQNAYMSPFSFSINYEKRNHKRILASIENKYKSIPKEKWSYEDIFIYKDIKKRLHKPNKKRAHIKIDSLTLVSDLQYVPNNKSIILCSAGVDGTILFWHIFSAHKPIFRINAHQKPISTIVFSTDGRLLASASKRLYHGKGIFETDHKIGLFDINCLLAPHISNQSYIHRTMSTTAAQSSDIITVPEHQPINLFGAMFHHTQGLSPYERRLFEALSATFSAEDKVLYGLIAQGWSTIKKNLYKKRQRAYIFNKQWKELAIENFSMVISIFASCADAYLGRALAAMHLKTAQKETQAIEADLCKAILLGDHAIKRYAFYLRAQLYLQTHRPDLALDDLHEASNIPNVFNNYPDDVAIAHALKPTQMIATMKQDLLQPQHASSHEHLCLIDEFLYNKNDIDINLLLANMSEKLAKAINIDVFFTLEWIIVDELNHLSNDRYNTIFSIICKKIITLLTLNKIAKLVFEKKTNSLWSIKPTAKYDLSCLYDIGILLFHLSKQNFFQAQKECIDLIELCQLLFGPSHHGNNLFEDFKRNKEREDYRYRTNLSLLLVESKDILNPALIVSLADTSSGEHPILQDTQALHTELSHSEQTSLIESAEAYIRIQNLAWLDSLRALNQRALNPLQEEENSEDTHTDSEEESTLARDTRLSRHAFKWMTQATHHHRTIREHDKHPPCDIHKKGHHGFRHR